MKYSLRSLMIVVLVLPPLIAVVWWLSYFDPRWLVVGALIPICLALAFIVWAVL